MVYCLRHQTKLCATKGANQVDFSEDKVGEIFEKIITGVFMLISFLGKDFRRFNRKYIKAEKSNGTFLQIDIAFAAVHCFCGELRTIASYPFGARISAQARKFIYM